MNPNSTLSRITDHLSRLKALEEVATVGPWVEDDGHVHSQPKSKEVREYVHRLMNDPEFKKEQGGSQKDRPETEVAHCSQELPNFDNDATFIASSRSELPKLRRALEAAVAFIADQPQGGLAEQEILSTLESP